MIQTLRPLTRREAWIAIAQLFAIVLATYGLIAGLAVARWWFS